MNRRAREQQQQRQGVWLIVAGQPVQVSARDERITQGNLAALAQRMRRVLRALLEEDATDVDDDGELLVPLGQVLDNLKREADRMTSDNRRLELVSGARKTPQVSLEQLQAEQTRENALAALRRAAQLVGVLRQCKHCPETLAIFTKGNDAIIVNASTGLAHEGECIGRRR